jgi:phospholipid/cholesterol/gamma-HCH transport system permease protein
MQTHELAPGSKTVMVSLLEWFGEFGMFAGQLIKDGFRPRFEGREFVRQLDELGAKSLPLVVLAGAALGVVMSMQMRDSLIRFGAKSLLPAVIVISIITESGPIITALVVSGRVAAGIGAELGSMKVTEQIDAIEASAVSPYKFLAATRVFACILALPLLTVATDFSGIMLGWIANTLVEPISIRLFFERGFERLTFNDLLPATIKTCIFGLIIGAIGCFEGMRATGGTQGVGRSATRSVVLSSLFVLLADVLLVRLILTFFP